GGDGSDVLDSTAATLAENPFVKFFNAQRGYVECTVTSKQWQSDFKIVPYVTRPGAPLENRASFVVESGTAGAQKANG
ncbi:MAG: hypothetical protein RLY14_572, partial [Planctomycetota bacterium]